jgi:hypothetical protein
MKRRTLAIVCFGLATILVSSMAEAQYQLKNLASNQVKQAAHTDPLLVNGWGLALARHGGSATTTPDGLRCTTDLANKLQSPRY